MGVTSALRARHAITEAHAFSDFFGGPRPSSEQDSEVRRTLFMISNVHRDADGAPLISNGTRDGLTNPPSGVGAELVSAAVLNLSTAFEADAAFLNEVKKSRGLCFFASDITDAVR
jgi:hypothetical protein